jgi:hypothetical protein
MSLPFLSGGFWSANPLINSSGEHSFMEVDAVSRVEGLPLATARLRRARGTGATRKAKSKALRDYERCGAA